MNISNYFSSKAYPHVQNSITHANNGRFGASWGATIPARGHFLVDAVTNAVLAVPSAVVTAAGATEAVYTWGARMQRFNRGCASLKHNANRVILSTIGVACTSYAFNHQNDDKCSQIGRLLRHLKPSHITIPVRIPYTRAYVWTTIPI